MTVKLGTEGALQSIINKSLQPLIDNIKDLQNEIVIARVTDIVLDKNHSKWEEVGGVNGVGTIFFESVEEITSGENKAKPFHSNTTIPPLVNELVLLFNMPSTNIGSDPSQKSYYYASIISLWNNPHSNPYPNLQIQPSTPPEDNKSYSQVQAGSPNKTTSLKTQVTLNSSNDLLNSTFFEKSDINPLQPPGS